MRQLHWDPTAIWRAGLDKVRTHIPSTTRMVDLDDWLKSIGCELDWDVREKRLRVVPRKEVIYAKSHGRIKFGKK